MIYPLFRRLPLRPARTDEAEWMDAPDLDPAVLAGTLGDLGRINHWLGGHWLTVRGLARLTADLPSGASLTVLDVATGGADGPAAILAWARRRGLRAWVIATDLNPATLAIAPCARAEGIRLAVADGRRLPFASGSVDVVTCSLVVHHLPPDDAVTLLREMRRVARRGLVVNDLVRNWHGLAGAWLVGRLFTHNPVTRHDATLSVRRAYTPAELLALARRAGLQPGPLDSFLGYRVGLTAAGPR